MASLIGALGALGDSITGGNQPGYLTRLNNAADPVAAAQRSEAQAQTGALQALAAARQNGITDPAALIRIAGQYDPNIAVKAATLQAQNPLASILQNINGGGGTTPVAAPAATTGGAVPQAPSTTPNVDSAGLPTGDTLLQGLPPSIGAQVKALASGKMPFPGGFALKSPYWQQMLQLVSQYDPSFDAVNYNARANTRKAFTSGNESKQINALNTALGHLGELSDAGELLPQHDLTAMNAVENLYNKATGDPSIVGFNSVLNRVAPELVKAYRGTGGAESDIQAALKDFNPNNSPAQRKAALQETAKLLQSKIDALGSQYQRGMGTATQDTNFYTPAATKTLQNLELGGTAESQPQAPASQPSAEKTITTADIEATAKASGKTVAEVTKAAKAKGYTIK